MRARRMRGPVHGRDAAMRMAAHRKAWMPDGAHEPGSTDDARYAAFCFTTSSRSARRRILPTGVFGSSSRNSMIFGRL